MSYRRCVVGNTDGSSLQPLLSRRQAGVEGSLADRRARPGGLVLARQNVRQARPSTSPARGCGIASKGSALIQKWSASRIMHELAAPGPSDPRLRQLAVGGWWSASVGTRVAGEPLPVVARTAPPGRSGVVRGADAGSNRGTRRTRGQLSAQLSWGARAVDKTPISAGRSTASQPGVKQRRPCVAT